MPFSVGGLLTDAQVGLEKVATDQFGAAVDTFVAGTLSPPKPGTNGTGPAALQQQTLAKQTDTNTWYATSYAAALSGRTDYRPKLKFLFKVQFLFTEQAKKEYPNIFQNSKANDFTFMVMKVDRPKIRFEYEDDVNMYNFRTRVLKKIHHEDMSMTLLDDVGNRVFNFFRTLMMIHSPITRQQTNRDHTLDPPKVDSLATSSGMAFNDSSNPNGDSAHRGVVNSTYGNSIQAIRVQQVFMDPTASLSDVAKMVVYDFINPRIISFDLDELSHDATDLSQLSLTFHYDWLEMVDVGSLNGANVHDTYVSNEYTNIAANTYGAPVDMTPAPSGKGPTGAGNGLAGGIAGVLAGVLGRGTQQLTSDLIGKAVKKIGGSGPFATAIGGTITSALSGPIGGLVSGASRTQLSGILSSASSPSNLLSRGSAPILSDSTSPMTAQAIEQASMVSASDSYATVGDSVGTPQAGA